jgi:hypothetical protein
MGKLEDKMLLTFLNEKQYLLNKFSEFVGIKKLNYTIDELLSLENKSFELLDDEEFCKVYHIYIGEVILNYVKGEWSIGKLKKDPAYHLPIILELDKNKMRLCPMADWFDLLRRGRLQEGISGMIKRVAKR